MNSGRLWGANLISAGFGMLSIIRQMPCWLAYVFGRRKDEVFRKLKALLKPFGIQKFYTDDWGAYERNLDENKHEAGKRNTQKIERKNLNFRTWIKRLARKTICFSKLEKMHDIVISLLINKVEFGTNIYA